MTAYIAITHKEGGSTQKEVILTHPKAVVSIIAVVIEGSDGEVLRASTSTSCPRISNELLEVFEPIDFDEATNLLDKAANHITTTFQNDILQLPSEHQA